MEHLTINEITKTISNQKIVKEVYNQFIEKLQEKNHKGKVKGLSAFTKEDSNLFLKDAQLEEIDYDQVEDLKELGLVKHLKIPFMNKNNEEGSIIYSFNEKHYSIQSSIPDSTKKKDLLKDLKNHKNYDKLEKEISREAYYLDYENAVVLNYNKYLSDVNENTEYDVATIYVKTTDEHSLTVGVLQYSTVDREPTLNLGDRDLGVIQGEIVQLAAKATCVVTWMNCMLKCLCGATSGACAIAVSGCIGACCGCSTVVGCIPCAGCIGGVAACGSKCTKSK